MICEAGNGNPCITCQTDRRKCKERCMAGEYIDRLDVFEMPMDAKIITTIGEVQRVYFTGYDDGTYDRLFKNDKCDELLIEGDIV